MGKEISAERTWKKIVRELVRERGPILSPVLPQFFSVSALHKFLSPLSQSLEQAMICHVQRSKSNVHNHMNQSNTCEATEEHSHVPEA